MNKMARNHEVRVKFSKEELEKVKSKADKLGMALSVFLRVLGVSAMINPPEIH